MKPRPAVSPGLRLKGEELLTDLFVSVSDLHFMENALQGADFVLALALEKLPSKVGLVSLFDINSREFVVVRQIGGSRNGLLLRLPDSARLQRKAMKLSRAVAIPEVHTQRQMVDHRWEEIGVAPRSLLCVPVERHGRYLGLIELANPHDGLPYTDSDGKALTYIGEQYAEFLDKCGLVVDPDEVLAEDETG